MKKARSGRALGRDVKKLSDFFVLEYWWSRRESNPRPQALYNQFYILSSVI